MLESDNFKIFFKNEGKKDFDYNKFSKKIIENFKADWAEYFNEISKRNYFNEIKSFEIFLDKYGWKDIDNSDKWPNLLEHIIN